MGMQRFARVTVLSLTAVFFLLLGLVIIAPFVHAADEPSVEAAEVSAPEATLEHMRAEIADEDDPELRAAMEEQLDLLESGQLDFQTIEKEMALGAPTGTGETTRTGGSLAETVTRQGFRGQPVDGGTGGGTIGGNYGGDNLPSVPPEAQAELEKIFSQGTGDPSKDGHLREQAEKVFEKYGIEHGGMESGGSMREAFERGGGLEQRGEGFERAMMEHMAPEAREQMERFMNEREMGSHEMSREGMERGGMEREFGGTSSERETMERGGMEREMMEREFGGSSPERSYEAPTREYETQTREFEAPTREYETQTREYEAPTHEYEAPTREVETQTREYEAPTREYEAPQGPGDGRGM